MELLWLQLLWPGVPSPSQDTQEQPIPLLIYSPYMFPLVYPTKESSFYVELALISTFPLTGLELAL